MALRWAEQTIATATIRLAESRGANAARGLVTSGELAARGAGGLCFAAGTPVHTSDGLKPIEEVRPGDWVWAEDEATGEVALRRVVRTFVTPEQATREVILEDDAGDSESIRATQEHPFWTQRGWVGARDLAVSDRVLQRSGAWSRVVSVRAPGKNVTVYNFEVEQFHTYFVGEQGVLVHNNCAALTAGDLLRAAIQPFKSTALTNAGRALTKHPEVLGFTKDTIKSTLRSDAALNAAAEGAIGGILTSGKQVLRELPRYGTVIEVQGGSGFGARWVQATGEFIGFINP